jgi:phytoene desaturase
MVPHRFSESDGMVAAETNACSLMEHKNAIVIGAGVAGMATAIRLAVQGFEVDVVEKNAYPGGKLSHFTIGDYSFDAGPSLFTQPQNFEELFAFAGESLADYLSYERENVSCRYFFEDGTRVTAFADLQRFADELKVKLGESEESLFAYLKQSGDMYTHIGELFLNYSLHTKDILFSKRIGKALNTLRWSYLLGSLHQHNAKAFRNPKTVQLFNRYATYNGSNPYKAPGMLGLIPHLEHNEGTFYPKGGMISLTNAIYKLALKKGVRFHFNTAAERIIHDDKKIKSVVAAGKTMEADVVVSNMDAYFTYGKLLQEPLRADKILKQERSSSAVIFYWGISRSFQELGLHNIFFTENYEAEFDHLFRLHSLYDDPTVYINITAKSEPGVHAPAGKENWFVMVNAPANHGQDWEAYREKYRSVILSKLSRMLKTDIAPLIEEEAVLDPVLIETRTDSYMGSLYGTSSNSRMAAFMRHPNFSKQWQGLYFVGGSVHPGGGIPLCMKSAKIASEMIVNDLSKKRG